MHERHALRPLRNTLSQMLDMFAVGSALPDRRAEDRALREAIREARPAIAKVIAALDRMETPDDAPAPGAERGVAESGAQPGETDRVPSRQATGE